MNARSQNKNLIFIIVFLLLTNVAAWLYFLCFNKNKTPDKGPGPDAFIGALKTDVGFDTVQLNQFKELKKTYWSQARVKMDTIRQVKLRFFDLVKSDNVPDSVIEKGAASIAALQKEIEINSFHHFKETRKLCRPEQLAAYDSLIRKIINRSRPQRTKPNDK